MQAIVLVLITEINVYVSLRSKANLYTEMKTNERQQNQLTNLLNTLPDNFLICTQSQGDDAPKSIFANTKIDHFFGEMVNKKRKVMDHF